MLIDKIKKLFEGEGIPDATSREGWNKIYTVEFDYATEGLDKNAIIKELQAFGLKVKRINMSGPGGGSPAVTATGSKKALALFVNSYDPDGSTYRSVEDFLDVHKIG